MPKGLYANINRRKKLGGTSAVVRRSLQSLSAKAYANMKRGFPKK